MHAIVHWRRGSGTAPSRLLLMATLFGLYPFLLKLYADGGCQGAQFQDALGDILKRVNVEIVKRSDHAQRFVVLPKRWIVERTFAWLGRCRRLAKDWERLNRKPLAFLKLASVRLMMRKLRKVCLRKATTTASSSADRGVDRGSLGPVGRSQTDDRAFHLAMVLGCRRGAWRAPSSFRSG
jgi:transposase